MKVNVKVSFYDLSSFSDTNYSLGHEVMFTVSVFFFTLSLYVHSQHHICGSGTDQNNTTLVSVPSATVCDP